LEGSDALKQVLDAGYSLRAATRILSGDFAYARHHWNAGYSFTRDHHTVLVSFVGGVIIGQAPLFERYVLGNSSTLRGWNKYDIDPLGGSRMAHCSIDYRYRCFQIFYDVGSVWDKGQDAKARNSIGAGLRKDGFSLAVAFPLRDGRIDPVFMAGMNF
jgi:outer membrane protein assembly factor BamA